MNAEFEADLVVSRRVQEADGVISLTLRHPDGTPLPVWEPGAHIDLLLFHGLIRQYSLCGDPADRSGWQIAVLREPPGIGRGGSEQIHATVAEGSTVRVRGPRNHFALRPAPRDLFVAGGIGITPVLPMVAAAEASGAQWSLLYGGRSRSSMAFLDRLSALDGGRGRVVTAPQDETGLLDLAAYLAAPAADALVYCCGPGPLLREARRPGCGARLVLRTRAQALRVDHDRAAGPHHPRHRPGRGRRGPLLLHRGHLRHLRDRDRRRRGGPPRLCAQRRGAVRERDHDDLRVTVPWRAPGPRHVTGRRPHAYGARLRIRGMRSKTAARRAAWSKNWVTRVVSDSRWARVSVPR
jgi:ferredoxin-NADP reductase